MYVLKKKEAFYRAVIACLCAAAYLLPARAADGPARTYTVDELIAMALSRYEELAAQGERVKEYGHAARQAGEWQNPVIGGELSRKSTNRYSWEEYAFSLTQPVYFPGKQKLRREIARFDENMQLLSADEMKLYMQHEVTRLSYEYAIRQFRARHLEERQGRMKLLNGYMKGRVIIAPQKIVESNIVQYRLMLLEKELLRLETDQRLSYELLNLYTKMNEPALPNIQVDWLEKAPPLALDGLIERADESSFVVLKQKDFLKKAEKEIELAEGEPYPDVGVSVFYSEQELEELRERTFGGGLAFPIPVLTRNKNAIERFRAKAKSEKLLLEHAKNSVRNEIRRLHAEYEYASSMMRRFPMAIMGRIENAMRYADAEFLKGRVDFQTYLDMETQSHETLETVMDTQMDVVRLYTGMMFLSAQGPPLRK